jgi:hypothetical protein
MDVSRTHKDVAMSKERNDDIRTGQATDQPTGNGKRPWVTPTLKRIKAGSAEVGTQAAGDGAFTTS